jgi:hypothetical protein
VLFVFDKLSPAVVPHERAPHEPVCPVITVSHAILVLQQDRPVDLILVQRPGDSVPVAHREPQDFVRLVEAAELAGRMPSVRRVSTGLNCAGGFKAHALCKSPVHRSNLFRVSIWQYVFPRAGHHETRTECAVTGASDTQGH